LLFEQHREAVGPVAVVIGNQDALGSCAVMRRTVFFRGHHLPAVGTGGFARLQHMRCNLRRRSATFTRGWCHRSVMVVVRTMTCDGAARGRKMAPMKFERELPLAASSMGQYSEEVYDRLGGMRALLEALPAAIYTTDAAGRITSYNDEAVR